MTTLLIDGDVVAYKIAATLERAIDWGDGIWTLHSDAHEGIKAVDDWLDRLALSMNASDLVVALTDQEANWRLDIWPDYKAHRKKVRKPLCLGAMRQHLLDTYRTFLRPRLEGDDVLGILATHPKLVLGRKIIVSADKDFFTIPGEFARVAPNGEVTHHKVSPEEAARFHLLQTLAGDVTDGYPGCPGMGMERAKALLYEGKALVPHQHTLTRGPRKGETETRWEPGPEGSPWEIVVSAYERAGLSEADALVQARVARILHHHDYDFDAKKPILWRPE